MIRNIRQLILTILVATTTISIHAEGKFTAAEQQQISIETPGLFDRSDKIQIDFTRATAKDYCFPLPVGKLSGNAKNILEITTKKGDAVKAVFDGTVRLSRNMPNSGYTIVIRHNNGLETVYALNAQNLVKVGDRVKAGQTIAIVGGQKNVPTLQFYFMVNGNRINPASIIDPNAHTLYKQTIILRKVNGNITIKTSRAKGNVKGEAIDDSKPAKPNANAKPNAGVNANNNAVANTNAQIAPDADPFQGNAFFRINLDQIPSSQWRYPLDDSHVISGYGGKRNHAGVDIKNGPGTNVYAAFDGVVTQSGNFAGYGKCITVKHYNGLETRYSHQSKNFVNIGDKVKAGQIIGIVGRTGRATTEHLHFETRIAGRAFDPAYIFDHANHSLQKGTLQFKKNGGVARLKDAPGSSNAAEKEVTTEKAPKAVAKKPAARKAAAKKKKRR